MFCRHDCLQLNPDVIKPKRSTTPVFALVTIVFSFILYTCSIAGNLGGCKMFVVETIILHINEVIIDHLYLSASSNHEPTNSLNHQMNV